MAQLKTAIPAFPVRDIDQGVAFYTQKLGFDCVHRTKGHAVLIRGIELHLWASGDDNWKTRLDPENPVETGAESFLAGTHSCRIEVDDVDGIHAEMAAAGVLHPNAATPTDQPYGQRDFAVLDHEGNLIGFFQYI